MGRTVSGQKLQAGQQEFAYNVKQRLISLLAEGKRKIKEGYNAVLTVKESLLSKTTHQRNRLELGRAMAPDFKKFAGKKANTGRIFEKNIARNKTQEEVVTL